MLALAEQAGGCLHQCRRCGMVYDCNVARCGQPFENGHCQVCSSPAAITMGSDNFVAVATN